MSFTNKIAKYQITYYGKRSKNSSPIALIVLYNGNNQLVGAVHFHRDGQAIPNNWSYETVTPKRAFLKMHERQIDTIVDMLRNEKPCSVKYISPTHAYIYTGREPIGEEETE